MKQYRFAFTFAVATLISLGLIAPVAAGKQVPFKGEIEGRYEVTVIPPVGTFAGSGSGHATHLGKFTYQFPHEVDFGTVPPAGNGVYIFTAPNGDTLEAEFTGYSSPVEPGIVFVVEDAVVTGGTGRFVNATGTFTVMRLVDQVNRTTTGSFEGSISSPGAAKR
jgi:hypothetical protein